MTPEQASDALITTAGAARLLTVSAATVLRIPQEQLDYWRTPGGHRRYRRVDVERYAREVMGRDIGGRA